MLSSSVESIATKFEKLSWKFSDLSDLTRTNRHFDQVDEIIDELQDASQTITEQAYHLGSLREKLRAEAFPEKRKSRRAPTPRKLKRE